MIGVSSIVVAAGGSIDLDPVYGANDIQVAIAALIGVAVIVFSALFVRFQSSRILEGEEKEHARAVSSAIRSRDRSTLRIDADADPGEYRDDLRELFEGEHDADVPTVRAAIGEAYGEWKTRRQAATRAVLEGVPALTRALSLDAVLYLFAGLLAVESLSTWGMIFTASSTPPSPGVILDRVVALVTAGVTSSVELAGSFPYAGLLWEFAFLAVLESGTYLYDHVYIVTGLLLIGSLTVLLGDMVVPDDIDHRLYRTRPRAVLGGVALVVATWGTGVAIAALLRALHDTVGSVLFAALVGAAAAEAAYRFTTRRLDDDGSKWYVALVGVVSFTGLLAGAVPVYLVGGATWGGVVGVLASLVAASVVARRELRGSYSRLTAAYEQADHDTGDPRVGERVLIAYVASRKVFGAFGVVAATVIPFYVLTAVESGRVFAIAEIAASESSVQVQATVGFVAVALLGFVIVQTRPAWGDMLDAFRYAIDRQGLKLALKTRGLPLLAVVLAFPVLYGSGLVSATNALLAAIGIAIAIRAFTWLATRAEDAYYRYDDEPPKPGRVFVDAVVVEDARGREIAVAWENDHAVAAPVDPVDERGEWPRGGVDELVEQIIDDTRSIFAGREPPTGDYLVFSGEPSVYAYYYDRIRDGRVDFDDVVAEYRGHISRAIDAEIENAGRGGIDVERLDEKITYEYDASMYERKKLEKRRKPNGIVLSDGKARSS